MKTAQYLDAAKQKLGIKSDYALAPCLGMTKQAISKMRNRPLVMSNTTAAKVAEILDLDPLRVIADMELERGSNDELWKRIAQRVAAAVLLPAIGVPSPAEASAAQPDRALYIMLNRRSGSFWAALWLLLAPLLPGADDPGALTL